VRRDHTIRSYGPRVPADRQRPNITTGEPAAARESIRNYEIRVEGRLTPRWSAWFDGFAIESDPSDGTTVICGPVVDQSALHGLLQKLRDIGLPLVSLAEVPVDAVRTADRGAHAPLPSTPPHVAPCGDTHARRIP